MLGQRNVVQTTPGTDGNLGYNYIAKDDDVWVYTGVTSATADNSIIGFVLVNQRTQESHFYSVSGATEDSAMQSAEGQVQNLRYTSTFPLLINVSNQPTYFMALKDGAGLVKKFAMIDIQRYQNVAVGNTVPSARKPTRRCWPRTACWPIRTWTPARLRRKARSATSRRRWWKATRTST